MERWMKNLFKIDQLMAMTLALSAWNALRVETLSRYWNHAGISPLSHIDILMDTEYDTMHEVQEVLKVLTLRATNVGPSIDLMSADEYADIEDLIEANLDMGSALEIQEIINLVQQPEDVEDHEDTADDENDLYPKSILHALRVLDNYWRGNGIILTPESNKLKQGIMASYKKQTSEQIILT